MKLPWRRSSKEEAPAPPPTAARRSPEDDAGGVAAPPPTGAGVPLPQRPEPPQTFSEEDVARQLVGGIFERAGVQLPGAPPPVDTAWRGNEPPQGYLETFLTAQDLPGMVFAEDRRLLRTFNEDAEAFPAAGGIVCGLARWAPDENAADPPAVERLIDLRWLFADPDAALRWHRERLAINAENMPPLPQPPDLGQECHAFGGPQRDPFGGTFSSFNFVFVVDRVLVKLFA